MLSRLAHFAGRAHRAIILSVRQPRAQLALAQLGLADSRDELDQASHPSLYSGPDIYLYDDAVLTFDRQELGHRKPANSLPGLVRRPNAAPPLMIEREPHKSKRTREPQWLAASFEPTPRSIREARKFFGSIVTQPAIRETGELLVSELTTNALRHASGPFEVRVRPKPRVRVEVRDSGEALPSLNDANPSDESGRGLQIVGRLARSWGTQELAHGKVVWFEL
jgi:hypothetical protein